MSASRSITHKLIPLTVVFGVLTTALALVSYAVLGFFSRYYADDYCMSGLVFQKGFWRAQVDQYVGWSNRYSGMFVLSLSEFLGRSAIKFWSAFTLVLLVLTFIWLLAQLNKWLKLSFSKWLIVLLAELVVFFTILFAPQLYQSFFWRIGLITYTLPLAFLVFLAGLVIHSSTQTPSGTFPLGGAITGFIVAFIAGGFSETYLVMQISLFTLALAMILVLVKSTERRNWIGMLAAVLSGSALSLLVVLLSPGNAIRQAAMPPPPGILPWIKMVVLHTFLFMYRTLGANPFLVLLAILIPLLLIYGFYSKKDIPQVKPSLLILALLVAPLIGSLLVAAIMAPAAYAQSSYPDGRVLVEAGFVTALMVISVGVLVGIIFSQIHRWAEEAVPSYLLVLTSIIAIILLLYPLYDARKNYTLIPEYQSTAHSWDKQSARIQAAKQAGEADVQVKGLNAPGDLLEIKSDPQDWVNQCAASFYNVRSITAGGQ